MSGTTNPLNILAVGLTAGLYLNALGWLGNAVLLREEWAAAGALLAPGLKPPWSPLAKELITLISDFVYAMVLVWIYAAIGPAHPRPWRFALELVVLLWMATVAVTYLALVNSGFLPWGIAVKTSLWALATFLPLAVFLPLVFRPRKELAGL